MTFTIIFLFAIAFIVIGVLFLDLTIFAVGWFVVGVIVLIGSGGQCEVLNFDADTWKTTFTHCLNDGIASTEGGAA